MTQAQHRTGDSPEDEILGGAARIIRTAALLAMRLAEKRARKHAEKLRQAQIRSAEEAKRMERQLNVQKGIAESRLEQIKDSRWWDNARPLDIARMYRAAREWQQFSPAATVARERIERETRDRYGVDISKASPQQIAYADQTIAAAEAAHARMEAVKAQHENVDNGMAAALLGEAYRDDRTAETQPEQEPQQPVEQQAPATETVADTAAGEQQPGDGRAGGGFALADAARDLVRETVEAGGNILKDAAGAAEYDSPERREATADWLADQGKFSDEAIAGRMVADQGASRPVGDATAAKPTSSPTPKHTAGQETERTAERDM
jgi:hypothetical protein